MTKARRTSCGVVITDGQRLLLGHAAGSPRWDIPKGLAEPGESLIETAIRELREETGLTVESVALRPLGTHPYLRDKDLALFLWRPDALPDPKSLQCSTSFTRPDGRVLPEFDRFAVFAWEEALGRVGKNLAQVLHSLSATIAAMGNPL